MKPRLAVAARRRRQRGGPPLPGAAVPAVAPEGQIPVLFEEAPVGLTAVSPCGRFLDANPYFCRLTQYSRQELVGMLAQDVTHPDDLADNIVQGDRLLIGEIPRLGIEKRYVRKDGTSVWVRVRAGVVRDPSGEPAYLISVSEEIPPPRAVPGAPEPVAYAGIRMDLTRREATWNGLDLGLSPKEILLLCYLIRHQGEVVSRRRLIRDVWGRDVDAGSRTLDAHICRLRRKIPPLGDLLVTVDRRGYMLRRDRSGRSPRKTG